MKEVTPLYIEIALSYACRRSMDFERLDAPACMEAAQHMCAAGLLEDGDGTTRFKATDGLLLWVERLCSVPFPTKGWQ